MWLRKARGTPAEWKRRAAEEQRTIERTVVELRAAGLDDACVGEAIRDVLETIEVCSVNVELLTGTGSFGNPRWVEWRSREAIDRLEGETDPVLLHGLRKIVRKWNEEFGWSQTAELIKALVARGDQVGAAAALREFREWVSRPDRKAFDTTGRLETPFQPSCFA
ncbi:MAG: hypothetical protein ACREC0_15220 [Methylocella sp.]